MKQHLASCQPSGDYYGLYNSCYRSGSFPCHRRLKNNSDVWERAWIEADLGPTVFCLYSVPKMQPVPKRLSSPASSSCSFRVKISQSLDFLSQTSHSNTLANPPRFFPRVNVINRAVCSVDWPSSSAHVRSLTFSLLLFPSVSQQTQTQTHCSSTF